MEKKGWREKEEWMAPGKRGIAQEREKRIERWTAKEEKETMEERKRERDDDECRPACVAEESCGVFPNCPRHGSSNHRVKRGWPWKNRTGGGGEVEGEGEKRKGKKDQEEERSGFSLGLPLKRPYL